MMDSSQVEVLPAGASELERFVDAMMDEHLGVMVEIVGLERESVGVVGAGRAGAVVGRVVFDLCAVRDAAASVVLDATKSDLGPLFEPGAPLGVYLTGLLMWSRGVARAMRRLARSTADGKPAWLPTRRRLDAAKGTYLVGLEDDALSHVEALCREASSIEAAVPFQRELRALVSAALRLDRTLRESFTVIPAVS
jgi:hypothetical protein